MNWRERNEIAEVALAEARPSGSGEWLRAECPFCPDVVGKRDTSRAFSINRYTGWYHCFRCGTAGRLDGIEPIERPEAPREESIEKPEHFMLLGEEPGASALITAQARRYLESRVPQSIWDEARIGACLRGKYTGRIVVPVLSGETWLGWVGRAWSSKVEKKYMYPPGSWRGRALYNHAALHRAGDFVYVVEGVFDALALWPNAVAVLGKPSHEQIEAMSLSKRSLVVVLDGDAHEEGHALALKLRRYGVTAGSVRLPPKKDPDEVDPADLWEAGKASLGAADAARI